MVLLPVLTPDVEVSVKLRRYHLTIPGEDAAFVYTLMSQAIEAIVAHGFDEFVLHVGKDDYSCRSAQRSLFDDHQVSPQPDPTPLADTPDAHQENDKEWQSSPPRCSHSRPAAPSRTP